MSDGSGGASESSDKLDVMRVNRLKEQREVSQTCSGLLCNPAQHVPLLPKPSPWPGDEVKPLKQDFFNDLGLIKSSPSL